MTLRTKLSLGIAIVAAAAATGCGPGAHTSELNTAAGNGGPTATSAPSAPVTSTPPAATPRPKPRVVTPAAPSPTPTPKPTPKPAPVRTKPVVRSTCGAPANPWGYNFCGRGAHIYSAADGVCGYFDCINNFGNGTGYMVQCNDGMYSMSGGRRGACSYHGGEGQPVYSGP